MSNLLKLITGENMLPICKKISEWFAANRRALPWRENPTPYTVLVSEVMAQQTRMAQLLPFYARFMARFPTLEVLAAADEDAVLAVWAGMGYYARARNLHCAARILHERQKDNENSEVMHDGNGEFISFCWPATRAEWEALPGIGPYTAGAILSIAFGQKEAAIDGNVLRVVARLTNDDTDISTPAAKKNAETFVLSHMPEAPDDISAYTQALMELGALVCTPGVPRCGECPLVLYCGARKHNRVRELPVKAKKKQSPIIPMTVLVILSSDGRVLMHKRAEGLLRGMHVYYLIESAALSPEEVTAHLTERGYTPTHIEPLGTFTHTFTHRVWQMTGYTVRVNTNNMVLYHFENHSFLTPDEVAQVGVPAAMRYFTV